MNLYQKFSLEMRSQGYPFKQIGNRWQGKEGRHWLVRYVPPPLIDAFLEWYNDSEEIEIEEEFGEKQVDPSNLKSLSPGAFMATIFNLTRQGFSPNYDRPHIFENISIFTGKQTKAFQRFMLEPFAGQFDVYQWLKRSSTFEYFDEGGASVYLNRINHRLYPILTDQTRNGLRLLGFVLPPDLVAAYRAVTDIQKLLLERFPQLNNLYRIHFLNKFILSITKGQDILSQYYGDESSSWIIAAGRDAEHWNDFLKNSRIRLGWDVLDVNLAGMSAGQIADYIDTISLPNFQIKGSKKDIIDFCCQMKPGDAVFVKKGRRVLLGYGRVVSDYLFAPDLPTYRHYRSVKWEMIGEWQLPGDAPKLPVKALTPITASTKHAPHILLGYMANPSVAPDVISETSFQLLGQLQRRPRKEVYLYQKAAFQKQLIAPFQNIFSSAVALVPAIIREKTETKKNLFSQIIKNDYGRGGAWPHYWGALYPLGGKRTRDAQLYIYIDAHAIRFGFYIGEEGAAQRKQFLDRCRQYRRELLDLLEDFYRDAELFFRDRENSTAPAEMIKPDQKTLSFSEWLANPEQHGLEIFRQLSSSAAVKISLADLAGLVAQVWQKVFPFFLLATEPSPLNAIRLFLGKEPVPEIVRLPAYPLAQCAAETGLEEPTLLSWITAVERKKQAILYGPPGTGKTYLARLLAQHLVGGGDGFVELVQFHPSYAYEDFIQGIRPSSGEGGLTYDLVPGRFLNFCTRAVARRDRCVLIIDEINRANLSRVFGELMYLLEYRKENIPLAGGHTFQIPENVRILGTMNTADRSIALVDHALRRRFVFIGVYPRYDILKRFHRHNGFPIDKLIKILRQLNQQIGDRHYEVGITFFMHDNLAAHLPDIWIMEIEPYLEEYFFDRLEKIEEFRWESIKDRVKP